MIRFDLCHAAPKCLYRGKPALLSLVLPDDVERPRVQLRVAGEPPLTMQAADGWDLDGGFTVYAAEITPGKVDTLVYRFSVNGEESHDFSIPCRDVASSPPLVLVTDAWWYLGECAYMEFYNPTDAPVDLFDFELLIDDDVSLGRLPLAAGKNAWVPPHERALVRHLTPLLFDRAGRREGFDRASFLGDFAARYPEAAAECAGDVLFFDVPVTDVAGRFLPGMTERFRKYTPHTVLIVPRGGDAENAVFFAEYNRDPRGPHPVHCDHAAVWYADPEEPARGQLLTGYARPTPGKTQRDGVDYDPTDPVVPAVLQRTPAWEGTLWRGEGDIRFSFAVSAPAAGRATLFLVDGDDELTLPAPLCPDGFYTAVLPRAEAEKMAVIRYRFEVDAGLYRACLGTKEAPLTLTPADNAGPLVLASWPEPGQALLVDEPHTLTVAYRDISGVDEARSRLCLDGFAVNGATFTEERATYTPASPLPRGPHFLEATLFDKRGNRTYLKVDFTVADERDVHLYRGQVHSHTDASDAYGTWDEAYAYAAAAGADFFAVTDHSQYLTQGDYDRQKKVAESYNVPGRFAALYGYEMSWNDRSGLWGHMNVIGAGTLEGDPLGTDLPTLLDRTAAEKNAVCMFNHPDDDWGDFGRFAVPAARDDGRTYLCEVKGAAYDRAYALLLSRGVHAAPIYNEDNHHKKWTTASGATGVVLAPALTKNNILSAMRRGRTYSTKDKTLDIRFCVNGALPGDTLKNPTHLSITAELATEDPRGIGRLELLTEYGMIVAAADAGPRTSYRWQIELDPDFAFYYLRVRNGDRYAVTAPVYVVGRDALMLSEVTPGTPQTGKDPHTVRVSLQNNGAKTMSKVTVDLYLSTPDAFHLRERSPYLTLKTDKLLPGQTRALVATLPDVPGCRRLTVVASAEAGSARFADAAVRYLAPALITKIMPLTSPAGDVENPFPYIELCNPGPLPVRLDGFALRFFDTYGKHPAPDHTLPLAGCALPPASALVVWVKPRGCSLTPDDFNARYGTNLDADQLLVTEQPLLAPSSRARRVELIEGAEVAYRVVFGGYCGSDPTLTPDVPLCFTPADAPVPDGERLPMAVTVPRPGEPEEDCLPIRMTVTDETPEPDDLPDAVTGLTHAPLAPLRAAALLAGALSAFKDIMKEK